MREYVEKLLSQYPKLLAKKEKLREQIASYSFVTAEDVIESMSFGHSDGEHVQSSNLSDKTAEIAMKYGERMRRANRQIYKTMIGEYASLDEEIIFFENAVDDLPDPEYEVMKALIIERKSWDEASYDLGLTRREIAVRRKRALSDLVRCYQKRASRIEAEILA